MKPHSKYGSQPPHGCRHWPIVEASFEALDTRSVTTASVIAARTRLRSSASYDRWERDEGPPAIVKWQEGGMPYWAGSPNP